MQDNFNGNQVDNSLKEKKKKVGLKPNLRALMKKILLYIPCLIGFCYLVCVWAIPEKEFKRRKQTNEYQQTCLASFYLIIFTIIWFLGLFIFFKILACFNETLILNLFQNKYISLISMLSINYVFLSIVLKSIKKVNLKNIHKRLDNDEKIILTFEKFFIKDFIMFFFISLMQNKILMMAFVPSEESIFYIILGYIIVFLIFPATIAEYLKTYVLTNKRIAIQHVFKCIDLFYLSTEEETTKQMKMYIHEIMYIGNDIQLDKISEVVQNNDFRGSITIKLKNGLNIIVKTDNDDKIMKEINRIINKG